jgi:hypothetical protein
MDNADHNKAAAAAVVVGVGVVREDQHLAEAAAVALLITVAAPIRQ